MSRKNQKDSLIRKCSDNIIPRVTYLCESYASALYLEQKPIQKQLCSKVNKQTVAQTKPHFQREAVVEAATSASTVVTAQKPYNECDINQGESVCRGDFAGIPASTLSHDSLLQLDLKLLPFALLSNLINSPTAYQYRQIALCPIFYQQTYHDIKLSKFHC